MKKSLLKRVTLVALTVATVFTATAQPIMAAKKNDPRVYTPKVKVYYHPLDERSEYQNFWSEDGDNRKNNPTTRNLQKMFDSARSWTELAEKEFRDTPGEYWQKGIYLGPGIGVIDNMTINRSSDMEMNIAHEVLEFLQKNCEFDKNFDKIVKVGKKSIAISDMEWPEMRKFLGKFDPYTVLCKATKAWHTGKKAQLNPLEFCILFELMADSTGWTGKGKTTYPSFETKLIVGERKQKRPARKIGKDMVYEPKKKRMDFRIDVSRLDCFAHSFILDMESVLRGELSVVSAFNEGNPKNDYGNGLFYEFYQLKKFYKSETD